MIIIQDRIKKIDNKFRSIKLPWKTELGQIGTEIFCSFDARSRYSTRGTMIWKNWKPISNNHIVGRKIAAMTTQLAEAFGNFDEYLEQRQKTEIDIITINKPKFHKNHENFITIKDATNKIRDKLKKNKAKNNN